MINPIVTVNDADAWFKTLFFPDGTKVVADVKNDELFFKAQPEECLRISGDEEGDAIIFALNPECFQWLPVFITEPYGKWGFNEEEPTHDFTFRCNDWVCELALKTAWNDYYDREEYFAISQDFKDVAFVTSSETFVFANKEYTLVYPPEPPEVGQCRYVEEFIPNRTYVMGWKDC